MKRIILKFLDWAGATRNRVFAVVGVMFLLCTIWQSSFCILAYNSYTPGIDTAVFDQAMWTTIRGEGLFLNAPQRIIQAPVEMQDSLQPAYVSTFRDHTQPFLFLLLPFYKIFPNMATLYILQALLVNAGAFFAAMLALKTTNCHRSAVLFGIAYLFYPTVYSNNFNFTPDPIAITTMLAAICAFLSGRRWWMLLFIVITLSIKETMALTVFPIGIWMMLKKPHRTWGIVVCLLSIIWFGMTLTVIPSLFAVEGGDTSYRFLRLYGINIETLRSTLISLCNLILRPFRIKPIGFTIQLLLPLAFLPLKRPWILAGGIPAYLMCVLSTLGFHCLPTRHWASGIAPWIIAAGILGGADYLKQNPQRFPKLAVILIFCLLAGRVITGWDHFRPLNIWNMIPVGSHLQNAHNNVFSRLRPDDTISADGCSFAYLFRRDNVTFFPNAYREADVVILRRPHHRKKRQSYWGFETLESDPDFELVLLENAVWEDIALFRRVKSN